MHLIRLGQSAPASPVLSRDWQVVNREVAEGRLRYTFSILTALAAIASGWEAYAQHRRGAFSNWIMWWPVVTSPPMVGASLLAMINPTLGQLLLPWMSMAMVMDGLVGFVEHIKGIDRLPGGFKLAVYNITMGPPIFAPLFFICVGLMGWLAALVPPERFEDLEL